MHAPRRAQVPPHPPGTTSSSVAVTPPLHTASSTRQRHHGGRGTRGGGAEAAASSPLRSPSSTASSPHPHSGTATSSPAPSDPATLRLVSPRVLWRAPAPRHMPAAAASLLPSIASSSAFSHTTLSPASRAPRPLGDRLHLAVHRATPARRRNGALVGHDDSDSDGDRQQSSCSANFAGDYDRLVFSPVDSARTSPRERDVTLTADDGADDTVARVPPPPVHEAAHTSVQAASPLGISPDEPVRGYITAAQAAAAVARLPELLRIPRQGPAAPTTTTTSTTPAAAAVSASTSPSRQRWSDAADGASARTPQSEPWWSTLDGTVSATNTIVEDGSPRLYRVAESPAPPHFTRSLNDTLGRADRAAMVLAMHPADTEAAAAASDGIEKAASMTTTTTTAVAALAMRLSRAAAAGGSLGAGASLTPASTIVSDTSRRGPGLNTLQELRDTLRLTDPSPDARAGAAIELSPSWVDATETGPRARSRNSVTRARPAATRLTADRRSGAARVGRPLPSTTDAGAGVAVQVAGGVGTQRMREALLRLYTPSTALAPAVAAPGVLQYRDGGGVGGGDRGSRQRLATSVAGVSSEPGSPVVTVANGASDAAGGQRLALTESPLQLPWQAELLTAAGVERRYGVLEAIHAHGGLSSSSSSRSHHPRLGPSLPSPTSPTASSVPAEVFSTASLTSSIFVREVGVGEAARRLFTLQRRSPGGGGSGGGGAAVSRSPSPARSGRDGELPFGMTMREAAAETYRQEQLRLYASHLATPATLPSEEALAAAAAHDLLDVDRLFQDTSRQTAGAAAGQPRAPVSESAQLGAASATASVPAMPVTASSSNALDRALRARAALLRRHVQGQPAWERQLYKVRQWCDRTRVMVRFDDGDCVERMADGLSHRALLRQHQLRQPRHGGAVEAGAACPQFVYADDPAAAHAEVMGRLAEEELEVERQNALRRYRERRHGSTLAGGSTLASHGGPLAPPEHSGVSGSDTTPVRTASFFGRSVCDTAEAGWGLVPVASLPTNLTDAPPALRAPHRNGRGVIAPSTAKENGALWPGRPSPSSAHATLCARLQTWGTEADADVDLRGVHGPSAGTVAALQIGVGAGRSTSVDSSRAFELRSRAGDASPRGESSAVALEAVAAMSSTHSPRHSRRESVSAAALTVPESELLCFVLTCATASNAVGVGDGAEHTDALLPLLRRGRSSSSSTGGDGVPLGAAVARLSVDWSYSPALAALGALLDRLAPSLMDRHATLDGAIDAAPGPSSTGAPLRDTTAVAQASADTDANGSPPTPPTPTRANPSAGTSPSTAASATSATSAASWRALLSAALPGYTAVDLCFLRRLHELLWRADDTQQQQQQQQHAAAGVPTQPVARLSSPSDGARWSRTAPPAVCPLTLVLSAALGCPAPVAASSTSVHRSGSELHAVSTLTVDAADLLQQLSDTALLRWLWDAARQSPMSSWAELIARAPAVYMQEWHGILAGRISVAASPAHAGGHASPHASIASTVGRRSPTTSRAESTASAAAAAAAAAASVPQLRSFTCDTAAAVEGAAWRVRRLHDVLHRASLCAEEEWRTADAPAAAPVVAEAIPFVGETPYLPGDETRARYPLDMRNLYLMSALAVEDVDARVVPQLREAVAQYTEAMRAATLAASEPHALVAPLAAVVKPIASLPLALQQRVHLDRLCAAEHRFSGLLSTLWGLEQSVRAFNHHVASFNAFTAADQHRWGPLYRTSLKVAYFVCEELAEKGMEHLSTELLPFVSVVASFAGCRGGHRELLSKLDAVMLELTERAKRVQLPLESLSWQHKRSQVLAEAVAAAQVATRRAAAVVSCLTTEADAVSAPLAALAMPELRLSSAPPLLPHPPATA
ncbi:hypothetical protein NESM_000184400 [Novymonas esmeraldas]|uniref:Uncharacterized protein n=1 Tax=Novymonas esmeraldas TaxID=1808958 RepID=A0AAW0F867_9TRYP